MKSGEFTVRRLHFTFLERRVHSQETSFHVSRDGESWSPVHYRLSSPLRATSTPAAQRNQLDTAPQTTTTQNIYDHSQHLPRNLFVRSSSRARGDRVQNGLGAAGARTTYPDMGAVGAADTRWLGGVCGPRRSMDQGRAQSTNVLSVGA
jgi:hypothetical protein